MQVKSRHAPPRAGAMIEALRGLGYNTATALADIIDNSIGAGADLVHVNFEWKENASRIYVLDNGRGMSSAELDKAMRLGERNPLEERGSNDLGRFGLGLKTASFSQCRRLTVATINEIGLESLRWDLDVLAASTDQGWHLLEGPHEGSEVFLQPLVEAGKGTLVLWEILDRIVTIGFRVQEFLDLATQVKQHLGMVFHRYISSNRLRLLLNGKPITAWDPFLNGHPSKAWSPPVAVCPINRTISAQCHVLPHRDRLTEKEYEEAAGPEGWAAQQGFYIYRNERLLVAGSWLGLGAGRAWTKDEAHRLARIRLDIPNNADVDWKIDIRKSTARPPIALRSWLARLAEETRSRSRRAFAHRGRPVGAIQGPPIIEAWKTDKFSGGTRYRIDLEHPAMRAVLDEAGALMPQIKAMLRVIEETVPVQRIWVDTAEDKETPRVGFAGEPAAEVESILQIMYGNLIRLKGYSAAAAREKLLHMEPFHNFPELIAALPDQP